MIVNVNATNDYDKLSNKPSINGQLLTGDTSLESLDIQVELSAGRGIDISADTISVSSEIEDSGATTSAITQAVSAETQRSEETYAKKTSLQEDYYTSAQTNEAIAQAITGGGGGETNYYIVADLSAITSPKEGQYAYIPTKDYQKTITGWTFDITSWYQNQLDMSSEKQIATFEDNYSWGDGGLNYLNEFLWWGGGQKPSGYQYGTWFEVSYGVFKYYLNIHQSDIDGVMKETSIDFCIESTNPSYYITNLVMDDYSGYTQYSETSHTVDVHEISHLYVYRDSAWVELSDSVVLDLSSSAKVNAFNPDTFIEMFEDGMTIFVKADDGNFYRISYTTTSSSKTYYCGDIITPGRQIKTIRFRKNALGKLYRDSYVTAALYQAGSGIQISGGTISADGSGGSDYIVTPDLSGITNPENGMTAVKVAQTLYETWMGWSFDVSAWGSDEDYVAKFYDGYGNEIASLYRTLDNFHWDPWNETPFGSWYYNLERGLAWRKIEYNGEAVMIDVVFSPNKYEPTITYDLTAGSHSELTTVQSTSWQKPTVIPQKTYMFDNTKTYESGWTEVSIPMIFDIDDNLSESDMVSMVSYINSKVATAVVRYQEKFYYPTYQNFRTDDAWLSSAPVSIGNTIQYFTLRISPNGEGGCNIWEDFVSKELSTIEEIRFYMGLDGTPSDNFNDFGDSGTMQRLWDTSNNYRKVVRSKYSLDSLNDATLTNDAGQVLWATDKLVGDDGQGHYRHASLAKVSMPVYGGSFIAKFGQWYEDNNSLTNIYPIEFYPSNAERAFENYRRYRENVGNNTGIFYALKVDTDTTLNYWPGGMTPIYVDGLDKDVVPTVLEADSVHGVLVEEVTGSSVNQFTGANLLTLRCGKGIVGIANNAFSGSTIGSIVFDGIIASIGTNAFIGFTGTTVYFAGDLTCDIDGFAGSNIKYMNLKDVSATGITAGAFSASTIERIALPGGLTSIGDNAFSGCSNLNRIEFFGTQDQWRAITKGTGWHSDVPVDRIYCSDGECYDLD